MAEEERIAKLRAQGYPRGLKTLFAVMTGALLVQLVLHGFTFALEVLAPGRVAADAGGERGLLRHLYLGSFWIFALAIPIGCVTWMRWLDWSVKNALVEGRGFGRTPAQVVWAYFLPGMNLVRPLQDLRALLAAARPDPPRRGVILELWWIVTLFHLATMLFDLDGGIDRITALSSALGVLSQMLALTVLRIFAARQPHSGIETGRDPAYRAGEAASEPRA
ncbi:DUF4328 domain-containing protein [Parvularcula oceani]|uniref:DUF4328 domain-containing protein n=1 Tax=Parvularcula oceani TaxID=1247963 RepID=UPI0004E17529|nr:DUF4328 domain-containing protein [Parvularcula oceani]